MVLKSYTSFLSALGNFTAAATGGLGDLLLRKEPGSQDSPCYFKRAVHYNVDSDKPHRGEQRGRE